MAELTFYYGAMNSGKSTNILQTRHSYVEVDGSPVLIKPATDTKGDTRVVSRIGLEYEADILITPEMFVRDALAKWCEQKRLHSPNAVLVDEAQFFTPSQIDELFWYTVDPGVPVMAYGLRTDSKTNGFPGASRLLELAHSIIENTTTCICLERKAILNARKVNGEFTLEGPQVAIDGESEVSYKSLCGQCYQKLVVNK